jgi:hypothetical protein
MLCFTLDHYVHPISRFRPNRKHIESYCRAGKETNLESRSDQKLKTVKNASRTIDLRKLCICIIFHHVRLI